MSNVYTDPNVTFDQCKLSRKQYADSIIKLIKKADEITENKSLVIALNSPWGTGKSTFVTMLHNEIENNVDKYYMRSILYNAWEDDFCDEPLSAFFNGICTDGIFDLQANIDQKNLRKLAESIAKISFALAKDLLLNKFPNVSSEFDDAKDKAKDLLLRQNSELRSINEFKNKIKVFKSNMTSVIENLTLEGKKINLLIIIDELDRCKPLYTIQMLEILKHIFDIPGLTFLLSVDFYQLKFSIQSIYGEGIDSEGYLRRYVSYVLQLPEPSKKNYLKFLFDTHPLSKKSHQPEADFYEDIIAIITEFSELTLRDINSIYHNFQLFFLTQNYKEQDYFRSLPFFCLIIAKYKFPGIYSSLLNIKYEKNFLNNDSYNARLINYLFMSKLPVDVLLSTCESVGNNFRTGAYSEFPSGNDIILSKTDLDFYEKMTDKPLTPVQYFARRLELFSYFMPEEGIKHV